MVRTEFNYPDLDILDSPLMSPFTSSLNGIPGSAIAETIFNDPDSWEEKEDADVDADEDTDADMEPLAWLVEEIEKFKANTDLYDLYDLYGAFYVDNKSNPSLAPLTGGMQLGILSSSKSGSQSLTSTQDISRRDSDAPARRRRLPSIPLEASLLPPPPSSPKRASTELPSQQLRPPSTSRPLPSISSPAGPRTRGSRVSSQGSSTRGFSLQHRPLRF
jgi:hypothetical protein